MLALISLLICPLMEKTVR
jgi:hypothetical protein